MTTILLNLESIHELSCLNPLPSGFSELFMLPPNTVWIVRDPFRYHMYIAPVFLEGKGHAGHQSRVIQSYYFTM